MSGLKNRACLRRTHPLPRVVLTVSKLDSDLRGNAIDLGTVSTTRGSGWVRRRHARFV